MTWPSLSSISLSPFRRRHFTGDCRSPTVLPPLPPSSMSYFGAPHVLPLDTATHHTTRDGDSRSAMRGGSNLFEGTETRGYATKGRSTGAILGGREHKARSKLQNAKHKQKKQRVKAQNNATAKQENKVQQSKGSPAMMARDDEAKTVRKAGPQKQITHKKSPGPLGLSRRRCK